MWWLMVSLWVLSLLIYYIIIYIYSLTFYNPYIWIFVCVKLELVWKGKRGQNNNWSVLLKGIFTFIKPRLHTHPLSHYNQKSVACGEHCISCLNKTPVFFFVVFRYSANTLCRCSSVQRLQ